MFFSEASARRRRASAALRKFGMTSLYESPSVRTDSGGGGGESQGNPNEGAPQAILLHQQTIVELIKCFRDRVMKEK